jgi:hypothetical protein
MIFRSPVSSSSVRISHSSFWPFSILQEKRSGTLSLIAFSSPPTVHAPENSIFGLSSISINKLRQDEHQGVEINPL